MVSSQRNVQRPLEIVDLESDLVPIRLGEPSHEHASAHDAARECRDTAEHRRRAARHSPDRPLSGGDFEGPRLRGTVLPGGSADWLLLRADGVLELDLRVTLRTDDGALISMKSFGMRHGPPDVMAAIGRGETVDPATYYFRTTPRFETAHPRTRS